MCTYDTLFSLEMNHPPRLEVLLHGQELESGCFVFYFGQRFHCFPSIHFLFPECMVILVIDTCRILSRSLTIILDKHVERVSRRMVSVVSDNEFD